MAPSDGKYMAKPVLGDKEALIALFGMASTDENLENPPANLLLAQAT